VGIIPYLLFLYISFHILILSLWCFSSCIRCCILRKPVLPAALFLEDCCPQYTKNPVDVEMEASIEKIKQRYIGQHRINKNIHLNDEAEKKQETELFQSKSFQQEVAKEAEVYNNNFFLIIIYGWCHRSWLVLKWFLSNIYYRILGCFYIYRCSCCSCCYEEKDRLYQQYLKEQGIGGEEYEKLEKIDSRKYAIYSYSFTDFLLYLDLWFN